MRFPVTLTAAAEGGFIVTFPDIPEAITQAESKEEAREMAAEALYTALEFYFEDNRPVPAPSFCAGDSVELPASAAAKVLLHNEMLAADVRPAELARRLAVTPQEVNRLTRLRHKTRIDSVADALRALGRSLELSAV